LGFSSFRRSLLSQNACAKEARKPNDCRMRQS
jgi:hypothetical protein